ncbi:hypothetical protein Trydic_g17258 [Trypoxylus dichotomus]
MSISACLRGWKVSYAKHGVTCVYHMHGEFPEGLLESAVNDTIRSWGLVGSEGLDDGVHLFGLCWSQRIFISYSSVNSRYAVQYHGVYEIPYKKCGGTYIAQTSRRLSVRVQEHKKDVNNKTITSSLPQPGS